MNTEYFPDFIRINYPHLEITDEQCIVIGEEFKKYLPEKFKHEESKLENFWDINPIRIIMNVDHPLKVSGYEPALILHFQEFIKKQILL
jgi:hypothetical protein